MHYKFTSKMVVHFTPEKVVQFGRNNHFMHANVRRYVLLAPLRGGACFCTRGAMQGYDCYLFILALAKTVTPGGNPRREPGQAAPLTNQRSSLARKFSRCGKANDIYRPVTCSAYSLSFNVSAQVSIFPARISSAFK